MESIIEGLLEMGIWCIHWFKEGPIYVSVVWGYHVNHVAHKLDKLREAYDSHSSAPIWKKTSHGCQFKYIPWGQSLDTAGNAPLRVATTVCMKYTPHAKGQHADQPQPCPGYASLPRTRLSH
jgi:hypothetical protein